jgi:hypothetical protein
VELSAELHAHGACLVEVVVLRWQHHEVSIRVLDLLRHDRAILRRECAEEHVAVEVVGQAETPTALRCRESSNPSAARPTAR